MFRRLGLSSPRTKGLMERAKSSAIRGCTAVAVLFAKNWDFERGPNPSEKQYWKSASAAE